MAICVYRTPSLAAGRLGCGWCETVVLTPVGYGDLFGICYSVMVTSEINVETGFGWELREIIL